jgi:hypothetical protein
MFTVAAFHFNNRVLDLAHEGAYSAAPLNHSKNNPLIIKKEAYCNDEFRSNDQPWVRDDREDHGQFL